MKTIGDRIREERTRLGMTQERVAGLYGCDVTQINGWERGRTNPSPGSRIKLAKAMGLKEGHFLEDLPRAPSVSVAATEDILASIANRLGVSTTRLKLTIEIG